MSEKKQAFSSPDPTPPVGFTMKFVHVPIGEYEAKEELLQMKYHNIRLKDEIIKSQMETIRILERHDEEECSDDEKNEQDIRDQLTRMKDDIKTCEARISMLDRRNSAIFEYTNKERVAYEKERVAYEEDKKNQALISK